MLIKRRKARKHIICQKAAISVELISKLKHIKLTVSQSFKCLFFFCPKQTEDKFIRPNICLCKEMAAT